MPAPSAAAAAMLFLIATPVLAQEAPGPTPAPVSAVEEAGLSFRLVDETSDAAAHAGETQIAFKDQVLWLEAETPITGRMVAAARPFFDGPDRRPAVAFQLTALGAARLAMLTRSHIGRRIAILVGGKVVSAPRIQTEMPDGAGAISGELTRRQASLLAIQINDAALAR